MPASLKIIGFVGIAFLSLILQTDLWPFSHFPMFSSNRQNSVLNIGPPYGLFGVTDTAMPFRISSRKILGAIHPSAVGVLLQRLVSDPNKQCLDSTMSYWTGRTLSLNAERPSATQLRKIQLVEMRESGPQVLVEKTVHE